MRGVFFDPARQDADLAEPFLDERRPFADGMFLVPQGECVPALGEQMDLGRNAGAVERPRVQRAVADFVDGVVPGLQQERRRRALRHVDRGIEPRAGTAEMPRIERDREVRATADTVDRIDRPVGGFKNIAGLRNEIAAGRKTDYADLVRIDPQRLRLRAHVPDRTLRVLQRERHLRRDRASAAVVPMVIAVRDAILGEDAGDAARRDPVADFRTFRRNHHGPKAASRKHDHGDAGVPALRRKYRHRRAGDVEDGFRCAAPDRLRRLHGQDALGRRGNALHVRRTIRPDRNLRQAGGRLPDAHGSGVGRRRALRSDGVRQPQDADQKR